MWKDDDEDEDDNGDDDKKPPAMPTGPAKELPKKKDKIDTTFSLPHLIIPWLGLEQVRN